MFLIINRVKLIEKKEFVVIIFKLDYKIFIIYVIIRNISFNSNTKIYLSKKAQISYFKFDKTLTKVFYKDIDFINIFFLNLAIKLLKYIDNNIYII